jgi:hypothetical protein
MRPILPALYSVNQRFPSGPTTMPRDISARPGAETSITAPVPRRWPIRCGCPRCTRACRRGEGEILPAGCRNRHLLDDPPRRSPVATTSKPAFAAARAVPAGDHRPGEDVAPVDTGHVLPKIAIADLPSAEILLALTGVDFSACPSIRPARRAPPTSAQLFRSTSANAAPLIPPPEPASGRSRDRYASPRDLHAAPGVYLSPDRPAVIVPAPGGPSDSALAIPRPSLQVSGGVS